MFVVLDLETTWLSAKDESIIEIACIKIDRKTFEEIDRFHSFVQPDKDIPEFISQITNIFQSDLEDAPSFHHILPEIEDFIGWYPIIGHNISFDLRFLESHGVDISKNPPIDTFFLANFLCSDEKSLNLWYLCEVLWVELENAHRALDDTVATAKVFHKLVERLQSLSYGYSDFLWYYFSECEEKWVHILRDCYLVKPQILLTHTDIAEKYIYILNKNIHDIQDISQSSTSVQTSDFIDNIDGFELRESQKNMLDMVDKTFFSGSKTIIEAPTGIGKTFAYLIPAIGFSLKFGESVHISTSTKALQDQIYYKDLKFLSEIYPEHFSYTKLKWKRNYLWVSSFLEFLDHNYTRNSQSISFILKILFWSIKSEFWELDELDFYGEEYSFLSDIHAWNGFVLSDSNEYKSTEFAHRARLRAKSANIIVTNNHILFQDIVSEGSLLWGVKNLVIDEAHVLEDVVTSSLKKSLSFQVFQNLFQKIDTKIIKYKLTEESFIQKQALLFQIAEVFSILEGIIFEKFSFDAKYKSHLLQESFFETHQECILLSKKIIEWCKEVQKDMSSLQENLVHHFSQEVQEIAYFISMMQEIFESKNREDFIYYITHDDTRGTQLHSTVLRPWKFLQENLWSKLDSVVLTSATLQMDDDFAYMRDVLSLEWFESYSLPSDFDYSMQALLFVPNDLGSIKNNLPEIIDFLDVFFRTVKGKTLVLFTAFFSIREVFTRLKISLEKENIYLLAQSISWSKYKQIDFFKKRPESSILLWTDTFWEGIDIPWDDLKYLIVHKIPFNVPTDPIFQARSGLYKDSFSQYAIPKSILKLKQGFGRLIRTKSDTGIIVFLDDRIMSTQWWKKYLQAFPKDIKTRYASSKKLIEILQKK